MAFAGLGLVGVYMCEEEQPEWCGLFAYCSDWCVEWPARLKMAGSVGKRGEGEGRWEGVDGVPEGVAIGEKAGEADGMNGGDSVGEWV
mmetsp:Transcript_25602/g.45472  ORF Transcript_25602/g.45472 Transcript_25602/m.45472 type:complete len:88 (+) Transcript_25602:206-469(+)